VQQQSIVESVRALEILFSYQRVAVANLTTQGQNSLAIPGGCYMAAVRTMRKASWRQNQHHSVFLFFFFS
jgi:hypothetical protein